MSWLVSSTRFSINGLLLLRLYSIQERILFQEKDRFPAHGWGVANVSLDLTNWPDTQGHTPERKTSYALYVTRGLWDLTTSGKLCTACSIFANWKTVAIFSDCIWIRIHYDHEKVTYSWFMSFSHQISQKNDIDPTLLVMCKTLEWRQGKLLAWFLRHFLHFEKLHPWLNWH